MGTGATSLPERLAGAIADRTVGTCAFLPPDEVSFMALQISGQALRSNPKGLDLTDHL